MLSSKDKLQFDQEYFLAFKILRAAGRIGKIWPSPNGAGYRIAPTMDDTGKPLIEAIIQMEACGFITEDNLCRLIDHLSGVQPVARKPARSETRGWERRYLVGKRA